MGMADVATVLFTKFLKFDPADAHWPDRDRFVLSAGHGSMLLYALLHLTGYPDMTHRGDQALPPARLEDRRPPGIRPRARASRRPTGPLGQGLATAVGMAIAERALAARYPDLVDHCTYVIAGDGCLMEGISHEAIDLAGHLKLGRLIVLWDDNRITIDGSTALSTDLDQRAALRGRRLAYDRASTATIRRRSRPRSSRRRKRQDRPTLIACRTVIGYRRAQQAGHRGDARRAARRGGDRGARGPSSAGRTRPSRFRPISWPRGARPATRSRAERLAWEDRLRAHPERAALRGGDGGRPSRRGFAERMAAYKAELVAKAPNVAYAQSVAKWRWR